MQNKVQETHENIMEIFFFLFLDEYYIVYLFSAKFCVISSRVLRQGWDFSSIVDVNVLFEGVVPNKPASGSSDLISYIIKWKNCLTH